MPPMPFMDSYGINTVPELPPQHESKYAGQFAPDGTYIGKPQLRVAYMNRPRRSPSNNEV
ncbi:unnamed protein product, partial [Anisakis simplex]|uniref:Chitin synthase n=1 Tax=Anisakis simplex TaxID=6269 RepID=A0A0M3JA20_ANISI